MRTEYKSKEALAKRADAKFKKEERSKDAKLGAAAYEAAGLAVAFNTARLRGLRLAREAADNLAKAAKIGKTAT
jgi:hypothetical protein